MERFYLSQDTSDVALTKFWLFMGELPEEWLPDVSMVVEL